MTPTAKQLALIAYETWNADQPRTRERLHALVRMYAATYFGAELTWSLDVLSVVSEAETLARRRASWIIGNDGCA